MLEELGWGKEQSSIRGFSRTLGKNKLEVPAFGAGLV